MQKTTGCGSKAIDDPAYEQKCVAHKVTDLFKSARLKQRILRGDFDCPYDPYAEQPGPVLCQQCTMCAEKDSISWRGKYDGQRSGCGAVRRRARLRAHDEQNARQEPRSMSRRGPLHADVLAVAGRVVFYQGVAPDPGQGDGHGQFPNFVLYRTILDFTVESGPNSR